jgi:hypothetical protein
LSDIINSVFIFDLVVKIKRERAMKKNLLVATILILFLGSLVSACQQAARTQEPAATKPTQAE